MSLCVPGQSLSRRGSSPVSSWGLEPLEARVVLSLPYYESVGIDEFAGFPGGEEGVLAGVSDNGRFLWSHAAEEESWGDHDPAFLVIDLTYHAMDEFPALDGAFVVDINSSGTVLAREAASGRAFLTDLVGDGGREYLEDLIVSAPSDFHLAPQPDGPPAAEALKLGDAGIIVFSDSGHTEAPSSVWGMVGGVVELLWESESYSRSIDIGVGNLMVSSRYTAYDPDDRTQSLVEAVRWTPGGGLEVLDGLWSAGDVNSRGDILGTVPVAGEPGNYDWVIWRNGDLTAVEDEGADGIWDLDDDGNVLAHRHESFFSGAAWDFPMISRDGALVELSTLGGNGGKPVGMTDDGLIVHRGGLSRRRAIDGFVHAGGDAAFVMVDSDGRTIASFLNANGVAGSISVDGGRVDYGAQGDHGVGGSDFTVIGLTVPRDGREYRFVIGGGNGVLESFNEAQHRFEQSWPRWWVTDLSAATAFATPQGNGAIAAYDTNQHLWLHYEYLYTWWNGAQDWMWKPNDITQNHLDKRGLATPSFAGGLDSFTTPWGAMNILGLDADGQVHAVWWSPGLGSPLWTTTNLSEATGAPKLVGNITASATAWNGMQIFGTDERGHLIVVWWAPGPLGWRWNDLTAEAAGEPLVPGSITGAVTRWNAIELVGRTADDQVATYWWAPGREAWTYESITLQQSGATPRIVGPVSLALGPDGSQHIAGVSAAGEVIHLYWLPDGQDLWRGENLTALVVG